MSKFSIQLQKQVVMALTSIILLGSGCEDRLDTRGNTSVGEGIPVDVTFHIGLADEVDAYTLSGAPVTKASNLTDGQAFGYALCPANRTKATASLKPAALYNLEIRQYRDSDGAYLGGSGTVFEEVVTGSLITATLQTATKCHLVLVAWGKGNTTNRLGTATLPKAQEVTISNSYMDAIDPSKQDDMNKMPYILHLTDVNVASDGSLYSADGEAIDIRLLLKRLAIRLNVDWTYNASVPGADYQLGQILLQSVPLDYKIVAAPDPKSGNTYPSLLDQFKTVQLTPGEISAGSYSCWLPANVRGTNPAATSLTYRIKSNAPTGCTYIDFQAINQNNTKQKLNYRVYLGSNDSYDFNLYGNRNYSYTVNFNHTTLPINDLRVSIIDPIPASQGNNNFVPTANCFMVAPGGSFCFNPYKYYTKGTVTNNGILQGWCSTAKIQSVKVLWQTKENGDVGDPVLGVVSSDTDHTNIVELNDGNGNEFEKARIYCRVAPNTTGGSGVIAAYDDENGTGNILWSWHIWVTNYAPSATADETVLSPANKRILKLSKSGTSFKPMMDRCLGAYEGYVDVPASIVDMSRANGFHYQRARKDPFPGSYPSEELPNQYKFTIDAGRPPKNCLNRYKPDGITWLIPSGLNMTSVHHAYQHPEAIGQPQSQEWSSNPGGDPDGRPTWSNNKTIHDPCPVGWRVPTTTELQVLINCNSSNWSAIVANSKAEGGVLLYYDETVNRTYMRFSGYPADLNTLNNVGYTIFMAATASNANSNSVFIASRTGGIVEGGGGIKFASKDNRDAQNIRCIQDR